jgi:hypothetical protein
MDAAMERYSHKQIFGLLIVEGDGGSDAQLPSQKWLSEIVGQFDSSMIRDSLPHRSAETRDRIAAGILGVTTWQAVCAATGVPWASLPDTV